MYLSYSGHWEAGRGREGANELLCQSHCLPRRDVYQAAPFCLSVDHLWRVRRAKQEMMLAEKGSSKGRVRGWNGMTTPTFRDWHRRKLECAFHSYCMSVL
jgi:hypothetical protein